MAKSPYHAQLFLWQWVLPNAGGYWRFCSGCCAFFCSHTWTAAVHRALSGRSADYRLSDQAWFPCPEWIQRCSRYPAWCTATASWGISGSLSRFSSCSWKDSGNLAMPSGSMSAAFASHVLRRSPCQNHDDQHLPLLPPVSYKRIVVTRNPCLHLHPLYHEQPSTYRISCIGEILRKHHISFTTFSISF